MTVGSVTVHAPGKINLSLRCGRADERGYHRLATVFHAVDLVETITAERADDLTVTMSGAGSEHLPVDGTNLVVRAARAIHERAAVLGRPVGGSARIHVDKQVPVAGGMGGGSADAAGTLVALNRLWGLELGLHDLTVLARDLGADVAFPLLGRTALGTEYGDVLEAVPAAGSWHWLLIEPGGGLSTPGIFRRFDELTAAAGRPVPEQPDADSALLTALADGDLHRVGALMDNDLQAAAFDADPRLRALIATARTAGALGAVVSGSGPTIAVLAVSGEHAVQLEQAILAGHDVAHTHRVRGGAAGAHVTA